jgi:hypothetical protein
MYSQAMESVKAETVDIVRYLLSYAYSSSGSYVEDKELTDSAVRNILAELVNSSGLSSTSSFVDSTVGQNTLGQPERFSRPLGQNVEMKRGDWICTRFVLDFHLLIEQLHTAPPYFKLSTNSISNLPRCDMAKNICSFFCAVANSFAQSLHLYDKSVSFFASCYCCLIVF